MNEPLWYCEGCNTLVKEESEVHPDPECPDKKIHIVHARSDYEWTGSKRVLCGPVYEYHKRKEDGTC